MKRRTFLTNASKAALVAPFAFHNSNAERKQKEKEDNRIGYAVVGLGFFASYVTPRIAKSNHSNVVALVSSDRNKALEWATKYGVAEKNIYDYQNYESIINNPEIDAVYIATPVGTHCEFALKAFAAKKHVLTEKTMASSSFECNQMIQAARDAEKKLMVAYRARYEPYNQEMIKMSRDETYGKVSAISAHKGFFIGDKLGKDNWRINKKLSGGGALMDIGIYSIQACRYIAGTEPIEVTGFSESNSDDERFKEVDENLSFMMRFEEGVLASGSASWNYSLQNRYRVGTNDGYYELQPATSNTNLRMTIKQTNPTFIGERYLRNVDQIPLMFDHFSECIIDDKEPLTNGDEGLRDLLVIEAIYKSIEEGRTIKL